MRRTNLGDLAVSAQGLGCMGMSEGYGAADWDTSMATIRRALDLGVTFIDTADVYGAGHNEVLVGRAIAGRRDQVQLATKVGMDRSIGTFLWRGEPAYIKRGCEASLLRLGVEAIDLYYLHRPPTTNDIEESIGAMAELVAEGKVRHLGVSEVDDLQLRRAHAVHPITAVQSEYSLWTRDPETRVLRAMRELGIGLVPYAPLGRGFLTGAVDVTALGPRDSATATHASPTAPGKPISRSLPPSARSPTRAEYTQHRSRWRGSATRPIDSAYQSYRSQAPSESSGWNRTRRP
jgi:aryl-alcohol dehydrogenase-like predicted oxidoreductase